MTSLIWIRNCCEKSGLVHCVMSLQVHDRGWSTPFLQQLKVAFLVNFSVESQKSLLRICGAATSLFLRFCESLLWQGPGS
jgi:hypothetical protein